MFLDKLWLRIKGELLALKEDFSVGEDLRGRAANLLNELEHRLSREDADDGTKNGGVESYSEHRDSTAVRTKLRSVEELEREWDDLQRQRGASSGESGESESPPVNPRELG